MRHLMFKYNIASELWYLYSWNEINGCNQRKVYNVLL